MAAPCEHMNGGRIWPRRTGQARPSMGLFSEFSSGMCCPGKLIIRFCHQHLVQVLKTEGIVLRQQPLLVQ
ncbi:hypothetical protein POPTR_010G062440v4 [Populus trichocarpa]|uniref:Uncharacterized protein n=1 Tax=Populus trichocarpa TaxID=3694 RepID=A0ACC0SBW6_POPTR|nr:hypothetical protein POPTR_010G062440v4 [Populus trichocarpa]